MTTQLAQNLAKAIPAVICEDINVWQARFVVKALAVLQNRKFHMFGARLAWGRGVSKHYARVLAQWEILGRPKSHEELRRESWFADWGTE